jgi:hypothetical protein
MELTGNLVVEGTLEMKPKPGVHHTLRFVDVDERRFVGGGMEVLDSDVGLWVMGHGQLDIEGEPRAGWNRTGSDPTWKATDEILTTPFAPGDYLTFAPHSGALSTVTGPDGRVFTQEAFNLTRSVRIEGTPTGRSHIFIRSSKPQNIRHAAIRYMGPRLPSSRGGSALVVGRYGLHFHMCGDGSRGSVVRGTVLRECGSHAFVPHLSHGIGFRDCIAHLVNEDAFWWDRGRQNASDDIVYDHCLVAGVGPSSGRHGYTMSGFNLPDGKDNVVRDSVVAGNFGSGSASGFQWQSGASGIFLFQGCVAHNNRNDGIFVWQNNSTHHVIEDFVAFRNRIGIQHGAYSNAYEYRHCMTFGNQAGLVVNARSSRRPKKQLTWRGCEFSDGVVVNTSFKTDADQPALIVDSPCASVQVDERNAGRSTFDFVRCGLNPSDWTVTSMHANSVYRVQEDGGSAYRVNPDGTTVAIPPFAK